VINKVAFNQLEIEYKIFGNGNENIICFHGHGRNADDFKFLERSDRKIISINLFFHGNSYFPKERIESNPLKKAEVITLFQSILERENVSNFHLLAYSQGGKFALSIIPFYGEKIKTATLLSPDGLNNKTLFNWGSRRKMIRSIFQKMETNPSQFRTWSNVASKTGFINPKVKKFIDLFSQDSISLERASNCWRAFRNIQAKPEKIGITIRKEQINFNIIIGKYDKIIRLKDALSFTSKANLKNTILQIDNGHDFFKESSIKKYIHLLPF
jgi:pimeloyl-ACP methyl ester carboxylesterase